MILYGKKFEVQLWNWLEEKLETATAEVTDQLDGPYNEDFVTVQYSDGAVKDMPISSFVKQIVKEII